MSNDRIFGYTCWLLGGAGGAGGAAASVASVAAAAAAGCERRSIDWTDWSSVVVVPNSVAELKLATLFGYCSFSYRSALAVYICRSPIVALNGSE